MIPPKAIRHVFRVWYIGNQGEALQRSRDKAKVFRKPAHAAAQVFQVLIHAGVLYRAKAVP